MSAEENNIKSLCAKAGLKETDELEKFKALQEKGFPAQVAFSMWYQDNEYLLKLVTGDFKGVVLEYNKFGKKKWPKGHKVSQEDRKLRKADDRSVNPQACWIHDMVLGVFHGEEALVVDAQIWDDPEREEEHPIMAQNTEPLAGLEVDLTGWGLDPKTNKLRPRKGAKAKVLPSGAIAKEFWEKAQGVDIGAALEKGLLGTRIYTGLVGHVAVTKKEETEQQTAWFKMSTTREIPPSMSVDEMSTFMGAIELPYWPNDSDGVLDEDELNKDFQGKPVKLCATIWAVKEDGVPTGAYKGRLNTMG